MDTSDNESPKIMPEMVNVGFWSLYEDFSYNNRYLTIPNLGTDEYATRKYNELYEVGQARGVNIISLDLVDDFGKLDCFLFSDFPRLTNRFVKMAFSLKKPMFLILEECEVVYPKNWDTRNHRFFNKVFTWHDGLIDNKKYFKVVGIIKGTGIISRDLSKKEKICALIARNKMSPHSLELYSEREEVIRWFEKNHPEDFDLYGYEWDVRVFRTKIKWLAKFNSSKLKSLRRLLAQKYPSWKGSAKDKREVLGRYKFAIAYDNAKDIPGYIYEKIFDCFFAGTVPVYRGANNVKDHIPAECFIDRRDFDGYEDLYKFMKNMDDNRYLGYLDCIENFLNSQKAHYFFSEYYANTIIEEIGKSIRGHAYEYGDSRF